MSARVDTADVLEIFDETLDAGVTLDVFINMAHLMVEEVLASAGLSEEILTEIERLLSAHFACIKYPRASSEGAGKVSVGYSGSTGMKLSYTVYGQQAMVMDSSGLLKAKDSATSPQAKTECVDF